MMSTKSDLETAAKHWSTHKPTGHTRWWSHEIIHRHINRLVCGEDVGGAWGGLEVRMRAMAPGGRFDRGVSVGCGGASKELGLLKKGIVGKFDLYEISESRVAEGKERARDLGVEDRVRFHVADAFEACTTTDFDLVYWNNALHHMFDVGDAIRWSRDRLALGGWFVMDDFIGACRFQWPDAQLEIATRVREMLPARFMVHPNQRRGTIPRVVVRPDGEALKAADPTEAADSERIMSELVKVFPESETILTGGVIYHLALSDVLANFHDGDEDDQALLKSLLLLDEAVAKTGESHYGVGFGQKV